MTFTLPDTPQLGPSPPLDIPLPTCAYMATSVLSTLPVLPTIRTCPHNPAWTFPGPLSLLHHPEHSEMALVWLPAKQQPRKPPKPSRYLLYAWSCSIGPSSLCPSPAPTPECMGTPWCQMQGLVTCSGAPHEHGEANVLIRPGSDCPEFSETLQSSPRFVWMLNHISSILTTALSTILHPLQEFGP